MKTNAQVEEVIGILKSCYEGQTSKDEVREQLSTMEKSLYDKTFWKLYQTRNNHEGLRSSHGYDYYDALLSILKETSKFYQNQ